MNEDKAVVSVRPRILDANGKEIVPDEEKPKPPNLSWQKDIRPDVDFKLDGHWFEIVGIVTQGIVCKWVGSAGGPRRQKTKKEA